MAIVPVEGAVAKLTLLLEQLPREGVKKMGKETGAFSSSNSEVAAQIPAQKILGKGGPVSICKASPSSCLPQGVSSEWLGRGEICRLPPPAGSRAAPGLRKPMQDFGGEMWSPMRPAAPSYLTSQP